jgi:hypothetical protein
MGFQHARNPLSFVVALFFQFCTHHQNDFGGGRRERIMFVPDFSSRCELLHIIYSNSCVRRLENCMRMIMREGFGLPSRSFSITLSLQEGYGEEGLVHSVALIFPALMAFSALKDYEIGGTVREEKIFYSYRSGPAGREMTWKTEPGVVISGLFPPNKFARMSDDKLIKIIGELVQFLADLTKQTSVHAEVCGHHFAWKREGQLTAHEEAQRNFQS